MTGAEFIRKLRRLGRKRGVEVRVEVQRGKGSHQALFYGERFTIVPHGKILKGTLRAMCRHLGIDPRDL